MSLRHQHYFRRFVAVAPFGMLAPNEIDGVEWPDKTITVKMAGSPLKCEKDQPTVDDLIEAGATIYWLDPPYPV